MKTKAVLGALMTAAVVAEVVQDKDAPHIHQDPQEQGPNLKTLSFARSGAATGNVDVGFAAETADHAEFTISVSDPV